MNMKKFTIILLSNLFFVMQFFAQNISIEGRVTAAGDREPLPGVNILIKGATGQGTVTDIDGNYRISVPAGSVLIYSSIGFETQEITVGNQRVINIVMNEDIEILQEVVIIGYGQQKKASVVGAISNIGQEELTMAAPTNLSGAVAGRIPGVLARLGDGNLGGGDNRYTTQEMDNSSIFIRGRATPNNAAPLVLVDGIESDFARVNPQDIEQFSVLKDASATAVYGVRGANGVILITTKRGALGRPKVTINSQFRMHQPLAFPRPLGAYDYAVLYNEALRNMGSPPLYTEEDIEHWRLGDDPLNYPDVDWYDEMVKDHFYEQHHTVNVRGGTEDVKYYISGEYNHAGGPFDAGPGLESRYDKFNLRTNFDFNLTKSTLLNVNLNGRLEDKFDVNYGESTGQRYYGSFWWAILATRGNVSPIKNPNGTWAYGSDDDWNKMATLKEGGYRHRSTNTLEGSVSLNQKLDFITPGLSFRGMYGAVIASGVRKVINPERIPALYSYDSKTDTYTLRRAEGFRTNAMGVLPYTRRFHFEGALNYEKNILEDHQITAMAIYIQSQRESDATLPVSYRGMSGRVTYGFKSKYLAEFNMGYNGSDQFAKGKRYAFLPAFSLGWVLSEENFIKENMKFIDFFKIRGSYGTAGNDKIGDYRYLYRYEFNKVSNSGWTDYMHEVYNFGLTPVSQSGIEEGALGNDNVSWEIAKKTNAGIDLMLFNNRINFTGDLFRENRSNILVRRADIPTQTGLVIDKLPAQNIGRVTNKGIELSLSYSDKIGEVGFTVGGNYTFARSNIDYIAEAQLEYPYQMQKDHPIGQNYGYVWTGKFYDYDDLENPDIPKPTGTLYAGDLIFEDLNNDGVIDNRDVAAIGHPTIPEKIFGFNISLTYKNFYLETFWQGASNVSSRFTNELRYEFSPNVLPIHLDRWVYDPERGLDTRETAKYPSLIIGGSAQTKANSTFQLLNSEYLRLKTAELGYIVPKKAVERIKLSDMKIFLSGSNLLTFDHIKYVDPEYNSGTRGNYYPPTRFYALGLNITF